MQSIFLNFFILLTIFFLNISVNIFYGTYSSIPDVIWRHIYTKNKITKTLLFIWKSIPTEYILFYLFSLFLAFLFLAFFVSLFCSVRLFFVHAINILTKIRSPYTLPWCLFGSILYKGFNQKCRSKLCFSYIQLCTAMKCDKIGFDCVLTNDIETRLGT